ncbi:NADP(H)-dependent aldo-keto reductase [Terrihabitans sp. B22-R8]|uniref:NADP(H)-dependent aldo-keto reductase n=1 Tax=Terrihabitans sp. B22-R8 TaxID=3425128 RepID=UPI00403D19A0
MSILPQDFMLEYRRLGNTDISVSSIALGTMTWGQQNTEAEGHEQLDYALAQGINLIDTAEMYSVPPRAETQGSTERIIGSWLKARGCRDKVVLASKVSGRSDRTWMRASGTPKLDRANITEAIDGSLRRLQTDYLDLYQLHWPDRVLPLFADAENVFRDVAPVPDEVPIEETLGVLDDLVRAGKVRHIGLSNETPWGTSRFLQAAALGKGPRVVSVQNAYNLLNRTYELGLAEFAAREQVGLLAYSPLAQGYLTGKYLNGARPAGARTTLFDRAQRYQKPGVEEAVKLYVDIARDFGLDPAQMAIAFVTTRSFVTSNIIGATNMDQLKADIASTDVTITPELEERFDAVHRVYMNPAP